jgi:hypothetical protein
MGVILLGLGRGGCGSDGAAIEGDASAGYLVLELGDLKLEASDPIVILADELWVPRGQAGSWIDETA